MFDGVACSVVGCLVGPKVKLIKGEGPIIVTGSSIQVLFLVTISGR